MDRNFIVYSNYFEFNNRIFSYRKKLLFDITETPKALFCSNNKGFWGYWINNEWLNESSIKNYIINKQYKKDVSNLDIHLIKKLDEVL